MLYWKHDTFSLDENDCNMCDYILYLNTPFSLFNFAYLLLLLYIIMHFFQDEN